MGQDLICFCFGDEKRPPRAHINTEPFITKTGTNNDGDKQAKTKKESPAVTPPGTVGETGQPYHQKQMPPLVPQKHVEEQTNDILYGGGVGHPGGIYMDERISHIEHPTTSISNSHHSSLYTDEIRKMIDLQQQTLDDRELQQLSMAFVNAEDATFVRFVSKYLNAKVMTKMWTKLDDNENGYIETAEDICDAITFMNMLYKVKQHQQKTNSKQKPKFRKSELLKESQHVSTWVVRKYGKKDVNTIDKIYVHRVTKDEFQNNLPRWLNEYIQCNGAID